MKFSRFSLVPSGLLAVLLVSTGALYAGELAPDCQRPQRPAIPDGGDAAKGELLAARAILERYLGDADRFLKCLRAFEEGLSEEVGEVDGHELLLMYNTMVDEMYLVGDEFNIALRKFKNR
jgi:hypothetical protein